MSLPIIIIGAGGHAKVLLSILKARSADVYGVTDVSNNLCGKNLKGIPILGNDDIILDYPPDTIVLVNGIGSVSSMEKRKSIYDKFKGDGYSFMNVVHPSALIMDDVHLDEGVQIMAGAIVQTGSRIGANSIINTGGIVDHDCVIGEHVHIAPGAVLSGGVQISDRSHVGTSATIIQGITVGEGAVIGAGAVVVRDVPAWKKMTGVPAKVRE